jgi:very-short-patch-repair endonuclease
VRRLIRIRNALSEIEGFCTEHRLPFEETRVDLSRLEDFANRAAKLPDAHWRLFNPGLIEDDATGALESLERHQSEWEKLHGILDEHLYLDALPDAEPLRAAILALREGPTWYRLFQRRWRAASAVHRSVARNKKRTPAENRLADLESVSKYVLLRDRWRSDPAWPKYCKVTPVGEAVRLAGYLVISRWYDAMRYALGEMGLDTSHLGDLSLDQAKKFRRDHVEIVAVLKTARSNIEAIDTLLPTLKTAPEGGSIGALHRRAEDAANAIGEQLTWIRRACVATADLATCLGACDAAVERRSISTELEMTTSIKKLFADQYRGVATDVAAVLKVLEWGQKVQSSALPAAVRRQLLGANGLESLDALSACIKRVVKWLSTAANLEKELQRYGACDLSAFCGQQPALDLVAFARGLHERLAAAATQSHALVEWSQYVDRRGEALSEGCGDFIAMLEGGRVCPEELPAACGYATFGSMVRRLFRQMPELARFSGLQQSQVCADFRRLDKEIIAGRGGAIAVDCVRKSSPPNGHGGARVDEKTEMVLLYHLIPQQRPRVPVRKLLLRAQASIQALKPCLMMGPQAVAQFLEPGGMRFDVVIMDEASQLRPEEAIGAIARGRQLVVVGDPKQLPPTTFFARQNQLGEDVEEFTTTEAESILDICMTSFRPSRSLRWHYRSQHHSLIAFSNHHFYKGHLIVCPSPYGQNSRLGVRATYLSHAIYDNQTNLVEAQRVVDAVVEHVTTRPDDSLGVVTLNIKQRDLISELLEERLTSTPGADDYRLKWLGARQGLFVKNLENVQGDERDCIVISTTFGRPPGASVVRQNFGPISRQGGWRRLNVLFTRARQSVAIYTSLRPEDIIIDGSTPEGTKALRNYLEYARSGLLGDTEVTGREPDSDFEIAVIEVLRGMNYEVTPQLGVSGFRIDIAVKHPDHAGAYLAAIECDGAQYHSAQSSRDRDRIRQEILESQGWRGRLWRIWSTDWFRGPHQEIAKLRTFLDNLRKTWTPEHAAGESWIEEGTPPSATSEPELQDPTVREMVDMRLLLGEADKEVRIGDTVEYVDAARGEDVIAVRITQRTTAVEQGLIAERTPLAQVLLGGVVGDEVVLNVPGVAKRMLRIVGIKRDGK